jgi:hypothetical protein
MLGFACPNCGHPAPIRLGSLDGLLCPACGRKGAIPEPMLRSLQDAAALLGKLDARDRQIKGWEQLAFLRAQSAQFRVMVLGLAGWGVFEGLAEWVAVDRAWYGRGSLVEVVGPIVGFLTPLAMFLVARVFLRALRARFEADFAADPATAAGKQPSCRVCGAALPAPKLSSRAVVRCRYCQSDSIVLPSVMRRIAATRFLILQQHAAAVVHYSRSRNNLSSGFVLLLLVLPVGLAAHMGWNRQLGPLLETALLGEAAPLPHRYVLVKTPRHYEPCIRRIDEQGRVFERSSGVWGPVRPSLIASSFTAARISARWLQL